MNARMVPVAGVVLGLGLGAYAVASAAPGGFTFSPPPGWLDVSRGAPEAQRQKAPPALLAQADKLAFVAFEPQSEADGFIENMNAVVQTGKRAPLPTAEALGEVESGLRAQFKLQGMTYTPQKLEVVKVAGVTSGRIVGEVKGPMGGIADVIYLIPGDMAYATVSFTTTPDKLAHYAPIFEAAVQSTRGAVEPASASQRLGAKVGTIIGGIAGALGAFWASRRWRKRREAATRPPASPPVG
jgi:hypothetical protein